MLALRKDLDIIESERSDDGSKRWVLRDPINNRFFKIGNDEVKILSCIKGTSLDLRELESVLQTVAASSGLSITLERLQQFMLFLKQNNLLTAYGPESKDQLLKLRSVQRPGVFKSALRSYLFLRVNLLKPNRLLDLMLPWVSWLFRPLVWWLILVNTIVGVYLTSRQWDYFLSSFVDYFSLNGVLATGIALILVKILHELGHALVTRHYGCSVNSMGVALLIFWPVLFTDTTDAWRLKSRRQRVMIGSAGVMTELAIASIALTMWNFVPEGILKSVLFILATTTWILTLVINLNPLMRFDGYFVLADLLGVDNLHSRCFGVARWKLREWMFGFGHTPPERPRRSLIGLAFAVWIYRFLLYLGIALIIYNYFFKILGMILITIQIYSSLVVPVMKELGFWWKNRRQARMFPNVTITAGLLLLVCCWFLLPSRMTLSMPAYLRAANSITLYSQEAGRLVSMIENDGSLVDEGDVLVEFDLVDLRHEMQQAERDISLLQMQLADLGVSSSSASPRGAVLARLRSALEKRANLGSKMDHGRMIAPFSGLVKNLAADLDEQQWVGAGTQLLTLLRPDSAEVVAYISEQDIGRLQLSQHGQFFSDGGIRDPMDIEVISVENYPVKDLDELYVASSFGGALEVRNGPDNALQPKMASYRVHLSVADKNPPDRVLRGMVTLEVTAESPAQRYWRNLLGLWRKEAGF